MRILISGGGTGGHLVPALALGEELRCERADTSILFVGTSTGMDDQILGRSGFDYRLLDVKGLRGRGFGERARSLVQLVKSVGQARGIIGQFKPQVVVGAGGYASVPSALAAVSKGIPLLLMEQNTWPGMANRLLGKVARRVCVAWDETVGFFPRGRVEVTGNPTRLKPLVRPASTDSRQFQILVLGGSSGAHRLNVGVLKALENLEKGVIKLCVVHQTGTADEELVRAGYQKLGLHTKIVPFIHDMAAALAEADLVVARAGAMTVSEVALAARPAVFVPYPFHRDRQQERNARVIERLGGAIVVADDENLADNLAATLRALLSDRSRLAGMGQAASRAARPDAARKIAHACFELAGQEAMAA